MYRHRQLPPRQDHADILNRPGVREYADTGSFWSEAIAYEFSSAEIQMLQQAATELNELCLDAVQYVIDNNLYGLFGIPEEFVQYLVDTWERDDPHMLQRFDFHFDGVNPPKLLECNATVIGAVLEAAVIQKDWIKARPELGGQFNDLEAQLDTFWQGVRERYKKLKSITFASDFNDGKQRLTYEFLYHCCARSGIDTREIHITDISWNGHNFVDLNNQEIQALVMGYDWQDMMKDEFGQYILHDNTGFIEPLWKLILCNKALLPILWKLAPNHPNLLEAHFDNKSFLASDRPYVRKGIFGCAGNQIEIVNSNANRGLTHNAFENGEVFQEYDPPIDFDGMYPVCDVWSVNGTVCCLSVREDQQVITGPDCRFVPHFVR